MGRKAKNPNHTIEAKCLMNELLDKVVSIWTEQDHSELKSIAEETEISTAKLRKLLITASIRDGVSYYSSPKSDAVLRLRDEGKNVTEIQKITGLSYTSVQGYLPHERAYNLNTMSAECERIKKYRERKKALAALQTHLYMPDYKYWLWRCICLFENYSFKTSGRGNQVGVKFKYTVSRAPGKAGRHYEGEIVEGFGNELFIIRNEKTSCIKNTEARKKKAYHDQPSSLDFNELSK